MTPTLCLGRPYRQREHPPRLAHVTEGHVPYEPRKQDDSSLSTRRSSQATRVSTKDEDQQPRPTHPIPSVCQRTVNIRSADDAGNQRSLSPTGTRPQREAANTRRCRFHEFAEANRGRGTASRLPLPAESDSRGRVRRLLARPAQTLRQQASQRVEAEAVDDLGQACRSDDREQRVCRQGRDDRYAWPSDNRVIEVAAVPRYGRAHATRDCACSESAAQHTWRAVAIARTQRCACP